jgi:hypothetical protein
MAGKSPEMPASEWLTYSAAAERLGVSPNSIAWRAGRWPMRKRIDTGELEIEVPGALLAINTVDDGAGADQELRRRVDQAVSRMHSSRRGGKERPLAKIATALRQLWWRLSQ